MTRRSMLSSFHVNLFALMPVRCSPSTCKAVMAETGADFGLRPFFMRATAWPRVRPTIWSYSGTRFPVGAPSGNCDPEYRLRTGYAFPNRAQPETASQFEASKRDAVSAWPALTPTSPFNGPSPRHRSQKIYEQMFDTHTSTCVFSVEKLYYSKNSIASRLFLPNGRYLINY